MKLKKNILIILMSLLMLCIFAGCTPSQDPTEFLKSYFQDIKDGDFEAAYDKLSGESQKNFSSKEDFILYEQLLNEEGPLIDVSYEKISEDKNKEIDGITYKNAVGYTLTETISNYYTNEEETITYTRYVVNEGGDWKIYRGQENGKTMIAQAYEYIGWMYCDGAGKDQDFNQAVTMFQKGLSYDSEYYYCHYGLAYVYIDLKKYDASIQECDTYIAMTEDASEQSAAYNLKGVCYQRMGSYTQAKKMYRQALDLNPKNEYAKDNLNNLN